MNRKSKASRVSDMPCDQGPREAKADGYLSSLASCLKFIKLTALSSQS